MHKPFVTKIYIITVYFLAYSLVTSQFINIAQNIDKLPGWEYRLKLRTNSITIIHLEQHL